VNDFLIYPAAIAGAPFLLLALLNGTKVFGPGPRGTHRRSHPLDMTLDLLVLVALAASFFTSLYVLAVDDPPDLRQFVAYGLMLGGIGVFLHGFAEVLQLYLRRRTDPQDPDL
jgi:hypothetical protein